MRRDRNLGSGGGVGARYQRQSYAPMDRASPARCDSVDGEAAGHHASGNGAGGVTGAAGDPRNASV